MGTVENSSLAVQMFGNSPFRQVLTEHTKESLLSAYLWGLARVVEAVRAAGERALSDDPDSLAQDLTRQILDEKIHPPRLVEWTRGEWQDGHDSNFRFSADTNAPTYPHIWLAAQVEGDVEMLLHFPDTAIAQGVLPLAERPIPRTEGGYHDQAYWMLPANFNNSPFGQGVPFVWTEVAIPRDVYDRLGDVSPEARLSASLPRHFKERLQVLVDEIGATVAVWSADLSQATLPDIEAHREILKRRITAEEGLEFIPSWRPPAPSLEHVEETVATDEPPGVDLSTERLSGASFNDFLAVIRKWLEPIVRSPRSFAGLPEEDMSGLLAATLNATFPFAGQEVFSYQGKTDIYVRADRLDGSTEEKVFILENHWWDGEALLHKKIDQLLGYCTVRDTEAALMAMIHERVDLPDVATALTTHPVAPVQVADLLELPLFEVQSGEKHVRIALVVVDLREP